MKSCHWQENGWKWSDHSKQNNPESARKELAVFSPMWSNYIQMARDGEEVMGNTGSVLYACVNIPKQNPLSM